MENTVDFNTIYHRNFTEFLDSIKKITQPNIRSDADKFCSEPVIILSFTSLLLKEIIIPKICGFKITVVQKGLSINSQ